MKLSKQEKIRLKKAISRAIDKHGDRYDYSKTVFKKQIDKATIICREHGSFEQAFHSHIAGSNCPSCGRESMVKAKSYSPEYLRKQFVKDARKVHGSTYSYDKVSFAGKKAGSKVTITCAIHGDFEQTKANHVNLKHKCQACATTREARVQDLVQHHGTLEERKAKFLKQSRKIHKNEYTYPNLDEEFNGFASNVTVECKSCGPVVQLAHNHMKGHGCRKCSRSYGEKRVAEWVSSLVGEDKVLYSDRKILNGKELDLVVPSKGFALEYCGVYWHSVGEVGKNYHAQKQRDALDKGLKLLTVFDVDWADPQKRKIIKSRIRFALGESSKSIYGRKCEVKEISGAKAKSFMDRHHLQGHSSASVNLALVNSGKIVAVMTLGKPRFSKNAQWEIVRFASSRKVNVVGGMSKLFSYFTKTYSPESVLTYADLRWGSGKSYENLGFEFVQRSSPSAWYAHVSGKYPKLYHRMAFQKHRLPKLLGDKYDPNLTASENIKRANYVAVYDCGHHVYLWKGNRP